MAQKLGGDLFCQKWLSDLKLRIDLSTTLICSFGSSLCPPWRLSSCGLYPLRKFSRLTSSKLMASIWETGVVFVALMRKSQTTYFCIVRLPFRYGVTSFISLFVNGLGQRQCLISWSIDAGFILSGLDLVEMHPSSYAGCSGWKGTLEFLIDREVRMTSSQIVFSLFCLDGRLTSPSSWG